MNFVDDVADAMRYDAAPNSMRPRIGSGVSGAVLKPRSHTGTPRPVLSRYLPNPLRVNRRAAGPDPERCSPASHPIPHEPPSGCGKQRAWGATPLLLTGAVLPVTCERDVDVRRHARPPGNGGRVPRSRQASPAES